MSDIRAAPVLTYDGQINDNPDQRAEYPRMMYRKTEVEHKQVQTDALAKCGETWLVINDYDGLLCDTLTANDAGEAEAMSAEGWDVSPRAAHGLSDGMVAVTTAKDARIAELEAMLAAQETAPAPKKTLTANPASA